MSLLKSVKGKIMWELQNETNISGRFDVTPAVVKAKQAKIAYQVHEYEHDASAQSYGAEAAEKLDVDPQRVFKTLVVSDGKTLYVGIIPVTQQLDLKKVAQAVGAKKVGMADIKLVERTTGYVVGGVSPLGQKKQLCTVVNDSAREYDTIYVSAGKRGLEIELSPQDLVALTRGAFGEIAK